ncbi:MAG TPA: hypothetical protein IAA41_08170 [Candidatus Eubacterium faecavium]|nr:hypothetical protein [Candidatus Eubacterium faecavium]
MKDKFIRVISPVSTAIVAILDAAVLGYGIFAVVKLIENISGMSVIFAVLEVAAIVVAVLVSKEVLSNGVIFSDDEAEFTGVDDNNIITYNSVKSIEAYKDTAASLTKNFDMRHSLLIFTLEGKKINTIDLGLVTNKTLNTILDEFRTRTNAESISFTQVKKADIFSKDKKDKKEKNETDDKETAEEKADE